MTSRCTVTIEDDSWLLMDTVVDQSACCTPARIYQRGFAVDLSKLDEVRTEFEQEKKELDL